MKGCLYAVGAILVLLLLIVAAGAYLIQLPQNGGPLDEPSRSLLLIAVVVGCGLIYFAKRRR